EGKTKYDSLKQGLRFTDIEFSYGNHQIIKGINLDIPKNKTIALVGESGSGKSTMVNLIAGLLDANKGTYLIDGQPLESLDKYTFQEKVGYISQDTVIFNASIYDNVTLWAEPNSENIARFEEALCSASLAGFVASLAEGKDTLLGNNGINLSGGQKQRISIARELFK
ncbi:ATP-binding cassette domain-containing protein, partial [Brucella sp. 21LCYQ03]|nr:ATP-binding cassette domain-containing protein [Brucella sp. 21LCYQ03]